MFPDAFAHTNLSPVYNRVSKTILKLERELLQVVPNISLKVDPELTSDEYLLDAVQTRMKAIELNELERRLTQLEETSGVVDPYKGLRNGR